MSDTDDVLSALEGTLREGLRVRVRCVGFSKPWDSPKRATITKVKRGHVEVTVDGLGERPVWCRKEDVVPEAAE